MSDRLAPVQQLFEHIAELLDVPASYYEKAKSRYDSIGEWLHRPASSVLQFLPDVYPQGSFRLGTVIRPLLPGESYDLDLVCSLILSRSEYSQADLKELLGEELKAYAKAHGMRPPAEKHRCWALNYADEIKFHMDAVPAIPEVDATKQQLVGSGVPEQYACYAIAITDDRVSEFLRIQPKWPHSNPRGFAKWFEERMKPISLLRRQLLVRERMYATVEDVPTYEWKTPLQRTIQILKRHRDVMFRDARDMRPISAIITTLATHAYKGEATLYDAITNILPRMLNYLRSVSPRVPNPANILEDFADEWARDPKLEVNFRAWHNQAVADVNSIASLQGSSELDGHLQERFRLSIDDQLVRTRFLRSPNTDMSILNSPLKNRRFAMRPPVAARWARRAGVSGSGIEAARCG